MYPERLLPSQEKFAHFELPCDNCFVCRWTLKEKLIDEDGDLNPSCLDGEQFARLSTNLIGLSHNDDRYSIPEDIYIEVEPKELTRTEWDKNDDSVPSAEDIEYENVENRSHFFLKIGDFHGKKSTYPYKIPPKHKREEQKTLRLSVEHIPNRVNLYHYEINTYREILNPETQETEELLVKSLDENKKWAPEIIHFIRDLIINHWEAII